MVDSGLVIPTFDMIPEAGQSNSPPGVGVLVPFSFSGIPWNISSKCSWSLVENSFHIRKFQLARTPEIEKDSYPYKRQM